MIIVLYRNMTLIMPFPSSPVSALVIRGHASTVSKAKHSPVKHRIERGLSHGVGLAHHKAAHLNRDISEYTLVRRNRGCHRIVLIIRTRDMKLISNPIPRPSPQSNRAWSSEPYYRSRCPTSPQFLVPARRFHRRISICFRRVE